MQRLLALLMVFVLLTGLLMGCTENQQMDAPTTQITHPSSENTVPTTLPGTTPPTDPAGPTEPTAPTQPTQPTDPPEPPEPPEPPQQDFFTRHGQGVPAADQIPTYAEATDTANLYTLPLDMPDPDTVRSALSYGDTLYISYWMSFDGMGGQCGLRVYDLPTGTTLYDIEYPEWGDFGPLADGGVWYISYEAMDVTLIDSAGQETTVSLNMNLEEDDIGYIYDTCIDPNGQYVVSTMDSVPTVMIHDLETGAVITPLLPEGVCFYTAQYQQGLFILNDYHSGIYLLEPQTGEYEHCLAGESFEGIQDALCFETGTDHMVLKGLDGDPTCYYLGIEDGKWLEDLSHGCAVLGSYDSGPRVHVADLRNQLYLADLSFQEDCYGTYCMLLDNGSLLVLAMGSEKNVAYLYDTATIPEDAVPFVAYQCTPEELEMETARIAQDILDSTGIEILYGSQGNDFVLYDYVGVVELEPFKVFQAVNAVAGILYQYPEGMLWEAWDCGYDGLKIYLCGSIYGVYSGSLDMAGGVTSEIDGYIVIAMDINNPIESVLPHEMSHVFDRRINYMWGQMDWMAVWDSFTPYDDAYINSYQDYFEYSKYTITGESDPEDVWFVDSYGRTYPTEDRATLMEAMFESGEELDYRLEYPHLLEKAKLYSYILRQCFPSCNGEEAPFWEAFLGTIDESVLP